MSALIPRALWTRHRLVRQAHRRGCGPACAAMLLGVAYDSALQLEVEGHYGRYGTSRVALDRLLLAHGYTITRRHGTREPFAPMHLCEVTWPGRRRGWHFVVMLDDGTVLDPWMPEPTTIDWYPIVRCIAGLTRGTSLQERAA